MDLGAIVTLNGKRWEVIGFEIDFAGRKIVKLREVKQS
jgi:hypothetical protein